MRNRRDNLAVAQGRLRPHDYNDDDDDERPRRAQLRAHNYACMSACRSSLGVMPSPRMLRHAVADNYASLRDEASPRRGISPSYLRHRAQKAPSREEKREKRDMVAGPPSTTICRRELPISLLRANSSATRGIYASRRCDAAAHACAHARTKGDTSRRARSAERLGERSRSRDRPRRCRGREMDRLSLTHITHAARRKRQKCSRPTRKDRCVVT